MTGYRYLLDGFNIIFSDSRYRDEYMRNPDLTLQRLIRDCVGWKSRRPDVTSVKILFDGQPESIPEFQKSYPGVTIQFTPQQVTADETIIGILARSQDTRNYMIVSNDNEVIQTSRRLGAGIMSVSRFLKSFEKKTLRKPPQGALSGDSHLSMADQKEITDELMQTWCEDDPVE
jgi:predicted RNA-binding protein with PIN domain